MIVTCVKTRMVHEAVRHLLPKSGHWRQTARSDHPHQPTRPDDHLAQPGARSRGRVYPAWGPPHPAGRGSRVPALLAARLRTCSASATSTSPPAGVDADRPVPRRARPCPRGPRPKASHWPTPCSTWPRTSTAAAASYPFLAAATRYQLGYELTDSLELSRATPTGTGPSATPGRPSWPSANWSGGPARPRPVLDVRRVPPQGRALLPVRGQADQHRDTRLPTAPPDPTAADFSKGYVPEPP